MKMGKKVREYKSGDFIFAKVKGYPAWPARVQKLNGKKYFVYFYGTGETANLPPNMIFDYVENKDKFLNKSVKRKDFNDGVKQIEYDFANNVPLEQVIGGAVEGEAAPADETMNDSTANDTADESGIADTTAADETIDEGAANSTAVNEGAVEDSDETGALVIDEGKKGKKAPAKTPAKETPKSAKEPRTPRGRPKKEEAKEDEEEKKEEEIVSRSGRKIRPKRYIDEQTEENTTLPSPAPKKRRGASPSVEKEKEPPKEKPQEKNIRAYNNVPQSELQSLKKPFTSPDSDKENILIAYLPSGEYVGVKLFQSRPVNFKNDESRLQWDKQAASNAIKLKRQLESNQITPQSISAQLVMDLNLTDEEKATLDKDREQEERKSRLHFLKTEMKLIELEAKIKTCLSLEKADADLCLKLLDEFLELDLAGLMLLKHPGTLGTVKRMRSYVGNTPSWELSEQDALLFGHKAHSIREQADALYRNIKELYDIPDGLTFWEFFNERVARFKDATNNLNAQQLLEMTHEPIELSQPTSHTMKAAIDAANEYESEAKEEEAALKKEKKTPAKAKKATNSTPAKTPAKRQSSRKQPQEDKVKEEKQNDIAEENTENDAEKNDTETNKAAEKPDNEDKETEAKTNDDEIKVEGNDDSKDEKEADKTKGDSEANNKNEEQSTKEKVDDKVPEAEEKSKDAKEDTEKNDSEKDETKDKSDVNDKSTKAKNGKEDKSINNDKNSKADKNGEKSGNGKKEKADKNKKEKSPKESEKEKSEVDVDEPRAKRSRESKKTEAPPPRSPAKRKSKS